jgi:hypothetical protein
METEHRTTAEPNLRNRNWRRRDVRDDLVIPQGALQAWVSGGQQIQDALFPGALSLRILKLLFVCPSDRLPKLSWRRLLPEFQGRNW